MKYFSLALPVLALLFLTFVAGSFITYFEIYPYAPLERAYKGLKAQYYLLFVSNDPNQVGWLDQRKLSVKDLEALNLDGRLKQHGVTRHNPEIIFPGYTIYSAGPAYLPIELLDMAGNIVHEWNIPVDQLAGPAIDMNLSGQEKAVQVRRLKLQADGSVIVILTYYLQHTPYGMGILKIDHDSNIIWQNMNHAHHDTEVGSDGRIYLLTHDVVLEPPPWPPNIKAPYLSENVTILDSNGLEIKTISVLAALTSSPYARALQYLDGSEALGDIMHANSIDVVEAGKTTHISGAKPGDILISIRNLNTLALIDPDTEAVTWAARGAWHMQHDADLLDNGNILLFDNQGKIVSKNEARILEIDPRTLGVITEFPKQSDAAISSHFLGSQQRLPNGNTIITESWGGRILEVTKDEAVAWEYFLPQLRIAEGNKTPTRATVYSAERFAPEELHFEFNQP